MLAVVTAKEFSSAIRQEVRRIGLRRNGAGVTGLGLSKCQPLLTGWFLLISQPRAISSVSNH